MKIVRMLLIGFAFWITTNPAIATLIDFDHLPNGNTTANGQVLANQYASVGVKFEASNDGEKRAIAVGFDTTLTNSSGNALSNSFPFLGGRHDLVSILFDSPVDNLSWLTRESFFTPTFKFYDEHANLIGSIVSSIAPTNCCRLVETISPFNGVSRIDILQPEERFWVIDNLQFTLASPVPEPTSYFMLLSGLAIMGFLIRRRSYL